MDAIVAIQDSSTNTASVKDWLQATKGMRIFSFVDTPVVLAQEHDEVFTERDFELSVKKVVRRRSSRSQS